MKCHLVFAFVLVGCAYSVEDSGSADSGPSAPQSPMMQFPVNAPLKSNQPDNNEDPFRYLGNDDGVGADFGPATGCDNPPCAQPAMR